MEQILKFPAQIDGVKTLKVKDCLRITLETDALSVEDKSILFSFGEKSVWVVMAEVPPKIDELAIPDEIKPAIDEKSPSKRLRDRMYVYYKKIYPDKNDFEFWYSKALDGIGQTYLDKID